MMDILHSLLGRLPLRTERGAIGMLIVGIVIGVLLVIFGIIKFLIPGE